jgi:hypothetical protein
MPPSPARPNAQRAKTKKSKKIKFFSALFTQKRGFEFLRCAFW